jgi:hypothetical protein
MLAFFCMIAVVSATYNTVPDSESGRNEVPFSDSAAHSPRNVHRRLARDRITVAPIGSFTGTPTARPVANPIVTVPVSLSAPVVLPTAPIIPPSAAPVVINATRAPTTLAPTTRAPVISPSPSSSNMTAPMVNLSNFDVLVTAITTGSTMQEQEEQLYLFRREIRLVLESYLNRTMNLTDLRAVELRAIVSRTRFLQTSQSVEQLYSYAGAAIFTNTTASLPDTSVVQMEQSLALSDTNAIQMDLDESLQQVVTIQSISLWTIDDDNSTDDGMNDDPNNDELSNSNNTTIIVTVAAGVAVLALAMGCVVWRRVRNKAPRPPPLVTATHKQQIPFSPYGNEDDELDAHSIVRDLEKLEDLRNSSGGPPASSAAPLSEPYMQLDLSGTATSSEEDSPSADAIHTPPSLLKTNINTMHAPRNDSNFYPNDTPEDELMAIGPATTSALKVEPKALVDSNALYSAPVIQVSKSQDSMDGYSLTSGFYGGTKPLTLQKKTPPTPVESSPQQKGSPSWMIASSTQRETPSDTYSSDSETHFSYAQIGIAPRIPSSALGPTLASMSMDSSDQASFTEEDSMLNLNGNVGVIADSPTFPDPRRTQHVYPDEDTPVITNARHSLSHLTNIPPAPHVVGGHDLRNMNDDLDDDSPLRATALTAHGTASLNSSMESSAAINNTATTTGARIGDGDSQPSDEMMNDDSMAQDLEGFTEELDRIKRDIGISQQRSTTLPITGRRILHAPSDEFGTAVVTPEEEWKRSSNYNVRRR